MPNSPQPEPDRRIGIGLPPEQRAAIDPIVTLSVAATVTDRIRLGTSVLVAPWYPPIVLARALASIDVASGGRLTGSAVRRHRRWLDHHP